MKNKAGVRGLNPQADLLIIACCLLLAIFFLPAYLSYAEEERAVGEDVVVITSQTLIADDIAKTILFKGSVVAKKRDMTLFADRMLVHYSEEEGERNVQRIDAEGNVRLTEEGRVVTSKFATYLMEPEEKIIFTGEPRASDGRSVVTGTKMISFVNEGRYLVENGKVVFKNNE
ncbi:LptA/OstA family protein [Thermodesulfovibrionales bacterium]|nr:LptA/OstA family protein [Thermodesulfovibrionales bacterium]MCL0051280.1 LptA/OstA family protein [Thermodesulfovibrionales bacterium]MCL0068266.1 LptA/OstA family protein [Thermodesulfovibrionales bacterium]